VVPHDEALGSQQLKSRGYRTAFFTSSGVFKMRTW
jgi:hypothetical protein